MATYSCGWAATLPQNLAERVVLLANRNDPDSIKVARHYAEARHVPAANIVELPMSGDETITWPQFVATIWQPLQDELIARGWMDTIPIKATDTVGRKKVAIFGHRIAYLVVCRGVPLRIMHDPSLYVANPPFTDQPFFRTNAGAVDSELSLIAQTGTSINSFVSNPLFNNDRPSAFDRAKVVKVTRLDGPTAADALALVDRAIEAERVGLLGRAYVDLGGPNPEGDRWLESVARQLGDAGFPCDIDRGPSTFQATARFDAPALYFGWYDPNASGPFALPGFRFPPGAIAVHVHSYSAETLRSPTDRWCGPLVAHGVTATVGNVFEPYLQLSHRPDFLLRALLRGDNFGDAAYYAEPALSWEAIAIGDPLYRPFAQAVTWPPVSPLAARAAGYAALRQAAKLIAAHQPDAARELAAKAQNAQPSLALGWYLSQDVLSRGGERAAVKALAFTTSIPSFATDEWTLARAVANFLAGHGEPSRAEKVYRTLLADPAIPASLRNSWLREAADAARAAGDEVQAQAWEGELAAPR